MKRITVHQATQYLGVKPKVEVKMASPVPLWKLAAASGPYVRLAALSGAAAVILGAIGSHRKWIIQYNRICIILNLCERKILDQSARQDIILKTRSDRNNVVSSKQRIDTTLYTLWPCSDYHYANSKPW